MLYYQVCDLRLSVLLGVAGSRWMVSLGSWHLIWATRHCKVTRTHVCSHMNMLTPTHCSCADSGFSYVGVQFGPDACNHSADRSRARCHRKPGAPICVPALQDYCGRPHARDAHAWPCSWSILSSAVIATTHHLQSERLTSECALCRLQIFTTTHQPCKVPLLW